MDENQEDLLPRLLNVFEVDDLHARRHFVCFLETSLAEQRGIDPRAIVGEFKPGPDQEFVIDSFTVNPGFVEALTGYMNHEATRSADLIAEGLRSPGSWLYVLDPRYEGSTTDDPPAGELLGCYEVDGSGAIVAGSFLYNENHQLFEPDRGVSALLLDRRFYEWLHEVEPSD